VAAEAYAVGGGSPRSAICRSSRESGHVSSLVVSHAATLPVATPGDGEA
jgi:hypothetical protein